MGTPNRDQPGWRHISVAGDAATATVLGDARLLFGRGPRLPGLDQRSRTTALLDTLGPSLSAVRWCEQVHGRLIASLSADAHHPLTGATCVGRCDGLMTSEQGLGLLVWTADCVPILIVGDGVVAAVHAGWRGCAAGVASETVRRIGLEHGLSPATLSAALGPAIGPCHYPVGHEVIAALDATGVDRALWQHPGNRVDLRAAVVGQLRQAGVPAARLFTVGGCTACDLALASYRRDGSAAGRQWSLVFRAATE